MKRYLYQLTTPIVFVKGSFGIYLSFRILGHDKKERDGFEYFTVEPVELESRPYRLVLLLYVHDDFLGVVNAFRVRRE